MADYFYETDVSSRRKKLTDLVGDSLNAFAFFNEKVFVDGALPTKIKELMAVCAAHITRCPYCIAGHVRKAREAGATEHEIAEAIMVAVAINAGASLAHSSMAMKYCEEYTAVNNQLAERKDDKNA
jgi:AhpD family alkylhydroperoxidase